MKNCYKLKTKKIRVENLTLQKSLETPDVVEKFFKFFKNNFYEKFGKYVFKEKTKDKKKYVDIFSSQY